MTLRTAPASGRRLAVVEDPLSGVQRWLSHLDPLTRTEVTEVAILILGVDSRLRQAIRLGLTFAIEGDWHHWLCSIAVTGQTGALVFHNGGLLDDPEGMLTGTGLCLRQVPLSIAMERPAAVINLVRSAIEHETDTLPVA
jgi:hypothetical protein